METKTDAETAEGVRILRVPQGRRGRVTRPSTTAILQIGTDDTGNARHQPVSRSRKKRRLALALRDIEPEAPPVVRLRRGRDGGPTAAEKGEWRDPDDIRPNAAKTGRTVRGFHAGCSLRKIQRVSREITDEHILAAEYVRLRWDVARVGFQAERDGLPVNQVVYLPRLDFSGAAHAMVRALDEFRSIWKSLRRQQQRMASVILLGNYSINYWCGYEQERTGHRPNEKIELGKLVGMMDHLAKYLDADIDEAKERGGIRV